MPENNHQNFEVPKVCEICGGDLIPEKVNLEDYQEGKLYIMENVPAYVCQNCGETWVPEPILEEFEKMIELVKQKSKKRKGKGKEGNK